VALIFHNANINIQETKREGNTLLVVFTVFQSVCQLLKDKTEERYLSLKTQEILNKMKKE
jgi:hypothetical protein